MCLMIFSRDADGGVSANIAATSINMHRPATRHGIQGRVYVDGAGRGHHAWPPNA